MFMIIPDIDSAWQIASSTTFLTEGSRRDIREAPERARFRGTRAETG
jgi:hypothetical protein